MDIHIPFLHMFKSCKSSQQIIKERHSSSLPRKDTFQMSRDSRFKFKFSDSLEFCIKHGDRETVTVSSSFFLPRPILVHTSREGSIMPVDTPATQLSSIHTPTKSLLFPPPPLLTLCGPRQINTNGTVRSKHRREDCANSRSSLEIICARYPGVPGALSRKWQQQRQSGILEDNQVSILVCLDMSCF